MRLQGGASPQRTGKVQVTSRPQTTKRVQVTANPQKFSPSQINAIKLSPKGVLPGFMKKYVK